MRNIEKVLYSRNGTQVVVLVELPEARERAEVTREVEAFARAKGMHARINPVTPDSYAEWLQGQGRVDGKRRAEVVILRAQPEGVAEDKADFSLLGLSGEISRSGGPVRRFRNERPANPSTLASDPAGFP